LETIESRILATRGHKFMLSTDLAELYAVETQALNQAVEHNIKRFPKDFMFQLTGAEAKWLVLPHVDHRGNRTL